MLLPGAERPVTNTNFDSLREGWPDARPANVVSRSHPFIDAVGTAFSQHRPLTISPDCIWLVIAQGFSHHLKENAEALRHRLVRHRGYADLSSRKLRAPLTAGIDADRINSLPRLRKLLGEVLFRKYDYSGARAQFEEYLSTTPKAPDAAEVQAKAESCRKLARILQR